MFLSNSYSNLCTMRILKIVLRECKMYVNIILSDQWKYLAIGTVKTLIINFNIYATKHKIRSK